MKATTSRVLLVAVAAGGLGLLASLWFNGNPFWRTQVGERAADGGSAHVQRRGQLTLARQPRIQCQTPIKN